MYRPQIAELAANENVSTDDKDSLKETNVEFANMSYFAQWIQQERFPQFVKVGKCNF